MCMAFIASKSWQRRIHGDVQFKGFALELNGAAARIWGNEAPKQNCGLPTTTAIPCGGGKPPLRSHQLKNKQHHKNQKMSKETNISVSEKGINLPYRRFLSDSASGLLLVIVFILFYYAIFSEAERVGFSDKVEILICLCLFLLATPIGLVLNGLSWFLFGQAVYKTIEKITYSQSKFYSIFTTGTKRAYNQSKFMEYFDMKGNGFLDRYFELGTILNLTYPEIGNMDDVTSGARRFLRSSMLVLIISIIPFLVYISKKWNEIGNSKSILFLILTLLGILILCYMLHRLVCLIKYFDLNKLFDYARIKIQIESNQNEKLKGNYTEIINFLKKKKTDENNV